MGIRDVILSAAGNSGEQYDSYVKTFMAFNGTNNSTTFTDMKGNNTLGQVGSGGVISTTSPKYGSGSLRIPAGSWLLNSATPVMMAGPFTWECWFKSVDNTKNHFIWCPQGTWYGVINQQFVVRPSLGFGWASCRVGYTSMGGYATNYMPPQNTWVHLACTRDASNVWRFFADGVLKTHTRVAATWIESDWGPQVTDQPAASGWNIGAVGNGGYQGSGSSTDNCGDSNFYIDDLRITNGICRYTSNFTPVQSEQSLASP